ncbi:MAG TPA: hypothetical protein VF168_12965 [Trueperaceae bacterium]
MRGKLSERGLTIVELIIAGFILTVILGIVGTYLAEQSRLNRATLVSSEVQDKARLVMQLVTQDLQLGGAKTYVDENGEIMPVSTAGISSCPDDAAGNATCLVAIDGSLQDVFSTVYVNTLRSPAESCREVAYMFDGDMLQRADQACGTSTDLLDPTADSAAYSPLAPNIVALDIAYKCSDGDLMSSYPDEAICPVGIGYLRSAIVSVVARSNDRLDGPGPATFTTVSGLSVTCPADFRCFALQQEVLMPNFKDR